MRNTMLTTALAIALALGSAGLAMAAGHGHPGFPGPGFPGHGFPIGHFGGHGGHFGLGGAWIGTDDSCSYIRDQRGRLVLDQYGNPICR